MLSIISNCVEAIEAIESPKEYLKSYIRNVKHQGDKWKWKKWTETTMR